MFYKYLFNTRNKIFILMEIILSIFIGIIKVFFWIFIGIVMLGLLGTFLAFLTVYITIKYLWKRR
jgi:hypothetical protein